MTAREDNVVDVQARPITDLARVPSGPGLGIESLEQMRARQQILHELLRGALKRTTSRHWLNYGNAANGQPTDPRPEDEAAVLIARDLGISWVWVPMGDEPAGFVKRMKANGAYEIMVTIRGGCLGQIAEEIGAASSDDGLLKNSKRAEEPGLIALESDVLKKARANALVRLVQAFGIKGVTWEMLAEAGIRREDCDAINFAQSESSANKAAAQQAAAGKVCPDCGKPMRLRKRTSDGSPFLGCAGFPDCKHIENVPQAADTPADTQVAPPGDAQGAETQTEEAEEKATFIGILEAAIPLLSARFKFVIDWCAANSVPPPASDKRIGDLSLDVLRQIVDEARKGTA
jgi:hypothetical protein